MYEGEWDGLVTPYGIDVAPGGTVYVVDGSAHLIQRYSSTGSYMGGFGYRGKVNGQFDQPYDVAIAPSGRVYVSDSSNHRIQYFTPQGSYLGKWGSKGTWDGQFQFPHGLAISPSSRVYVVDSGNHRIQYFTSTGSFLGKCGKKAKGNSGLAYPRLIALGPQGDVYVTDGHFIHVFTADGSFRRRWGGYLYPGGWVFQHATGIAVDSRSRVFVADFGDDSVKYFTAFGSFLGKWGTLGSAPGEFQNPYGLAFSRTEARIYVTCHEDGCVQYFNRNATSVIPTSLGRVKALFR